MCVMWICVCVLGVYVCGVWLCVCGLCVVCICGVGVYGPTCAAHMLFYLHNKLMSRAYFYAHLIDYETETQPLVSH